MTAPDEPLKDAALCAALDMRQSVAELLDLLASGNALVVSIDDAIRDVRADLEKFDATIAAMPTAPEDCPR